MSVRFNLRRFEAATYGRLAYLCRYGHVSWPSALGFTREQADKLQRALGDIVEKENGK